MQSSFRFNLACLCTAVAVTYSSGDYRWAPVRPAPRSNRDPNSGFHENRQSGEQTGLIHTVIQFAIDDTHLPPSAARNQICPDCLRRLSRTVGEDQDGAMSRAICRNQETIEICEDGRKRAKETGWVVSLFLSTARDS